jgi:8-oxo-dGTP diphosphatase
MPSIDVAVALILNPRNEILIARRQSHQHQGGLWEFPGGKREGDEDGFTTLQREIEEEVGLQIQSAEPFQQIAHDYGDKQVLLDIWLVSDYQGNAVGREGQEIKWADCASLNAATFPAANHEIIEALKQHLNQ